MRVAIEQRLEQWNPWIYLALLAATTFALLVLFVFAVQQHNSLAHQTHRTAMLSRSVAVQTHRIAVLSQKMCQNINHSRIDSNNSIRKPLKATTQALATILRASSVSTTRPRTATQKAALLVLANQFQKYADTVTISKASACTFTK